MRPVGRRQPPCIYIYAHSGFSVNARGGEHSIFRRPRAQWLLALTRGFVSVGHFFFIFSDHACDGLSSIYCALNSSFFYIYKGLIVGRCDGFVRACVRE